ncbi:hypothetical protein [Flavobacterium sp.]
MKKVTFILASVAMVFFASCKEETQKTTEKTIVVEKPVEAEPAPAPVEVTTESDGTSVNVNKDGVEFSTKDGKKKTEIEVKDGGGNVTIKK